MSKEVLTLLSPKSNRIDRVGVGGKSELSWEMVSQVLARLPDHISAYARMKYNGEFKGEGYGSNFHIALDAVRSLAGCLDLQERLRASRFLSLTRIALFEAVSDGQICPACNGTGQQIKQSSCHTCTFCSGRGKLKFTNEFIAGLAQYGGVRSFQRYGRPVYSIILREITSNWDSRIEVECKRLLKI